MMRTIALTVALLAWAVAPAHAAEGEWLAGDLHVHSTYSHDSYGGPSDDNTGPEEFYTLGWSVGEQFQNAVTRGLDYLAITDHNDIRSQQDPGFGAGGVIPLPGYENSLEGHAQMLGATRLYDNGDQSAAAVQAVADALRTMDGGAFQVNHPAEGSTDFPHDTDWTYGYEVRPDTVEVWNISRLYQPPMPSGSSNDDAVRYWQGWLDRGRRVGATGGSDNHWQSTTAAQGAGQPTTWVYARNRSVPAVLAALRAGRTFVSHQPPGLGGPRLLLEADRNGDGRYESRVGSRVRPRTRLRVRVLGAPGTMLRVVTNRGRRAFRPVPVTRARFGHRFRLPRRRTWVRAEIYQRDLPRRRAALCDDLVGDQTTYCRNRLAVVAMTSALYLRRR